MNLAKVPFHWLQQKFGKVKPRSEYCRYDGTRLSPLSTDFSLMIRYTTLGCRWCIRKDPEYQDFKARLHEAAKLLQDGDHEKRVEGASIIVKLVEEGASVRQLVGPFRYCGNCGHTVEEPGVDNEGQFLPCPNCGHRGVSMLY
jgi:hypothetical protein